MWIIGRHPEWGRRTGRTTAGPAALRRPAAGRARGAGRPAWPGSGRRRRSQELLADCLRDPKGAPESRRLALRAMAASGQKTTPDAWVNALTDALATDDADTLRVAVTTARALPAPKTPPEKLVKALLRLGEDPARPETVRLNALAAVPGGLADVRPETFTFLVERLDREQPVVGALLGRRRPVPRQADAGAARHPGRGAEDDRADGGQPPARRLRADDGRPGRAGPGGGPGRAGGPRRPAGVGGQAAPGEVRAEGEGRGREAVRRPRRRPGERAPERSRNWPAG